MNWQLNAILLVQAVGPLVFLAIPSLYINLCGLFQLSAGDDSASLSAQSSVTLSLNWLPVMNGTITLLVIGAYRTYSGVAVYSLLTASTEVWMGGRRVEWAWPQRD